MVVPVPHDLTPLLRRVGWCAQECHVSAYAVGGCVRDWVLGMTKTPDVDVAVEGDGPALAQVVAAALTATLTVHAAFGTATLLLRQGAVRRLDVATCRREVYAKPAAYPRVEPGTLREDLARRDFTINAMAVSMGPGRMGQLVDPFGGVRDLRAKRLRVLHPGSFRDDPSRILRGVRFAERFGLSWERQTHRALREALAQGALGWLNAGRLRKEFTAMLNEPDSIACFLHMARLLAGRPGRPR